MSYRVIINESTVVECGSVREVLDLIVEAEQRKLPAAIDRESSQPFHPAVKSASRPKVPTYNLGYGEVYATHRRLALEHLQARGKPDTQASIAKACNIPIGSISTVLEHAWFTRLPDKKYWIAGKEPPAYTTEPADRPRFRSQDHKPVSPDIARRRALYKDWLEAVRMRLVENERPVPERDLVQEFYIPGKFVDELFADPLFERTERGLWLAGRALPDVDLKGLGDRIYELIKTAGQKKPAIIAAELDCSTEQVVAAIEDDDRFVRDLAGIAIVFPSVA